MSRKGKLRVHFDDPDVGWIGIELLAGELRCSFPVEYVPHDLIQQLTDALGNLLRGDSETIARANDGPIEYEFSFRKTGPEIQLEVCVLSERLQGREREPVFAATGSADEIIRAFWKALRDLETRFSRDEYRRRWREPFPAHEMAYLTAQLAKLKTPADKKTRPE